VDFNKTCGQSGVDDGRASCTLKYTVKVGVSSQSPSATCPEPDGTTYDVGQTNLNFVKDGDIVDLNDNGSDSDEFQSADSFSSSPVEFTDTVTVTCGSSAQKTYTLSSVDSTDPGAWVDVGDGPDDATVRPPTKKVKVACDGCKTNQL